MKYTAKDYEVRIWYSDEDEGFVAAAVAIPSISVVAETREEAAREIEAALTVALGLYKDDGEEPPTPSRTVALGAALLGSLGGLSKSPAKVEAARANGAKGGRPRKSTYSQPSDGRLAKAMVQESPVSHTTKRAKKRKS
jgi:predicted RNase H-like HicB family nuclease